MKILYILLNIVSGASLVQLVALWTTYHYHLSSNLGVGISESYFVFDFASLPQEVARPISPNMRTNVAVRHQSSSATLEGENPEHSSTEHSLCHSHYTLRIPHTVFRVCKCQQSVTLIRVTKSCDRSGNKATSAGFRSRVVQGRTLPVTRNSTPVILI